MDLLEERVGVPPRPLAPAERPRRLPLREAERPEGAADFVLLGDAMRRVCDILGEATGARYSDDLLDRLFARFCVGK